MLRRSLAQKLLDTLSFPLRAFLLIEKDRFGLSSLATDRFDFVAQEVQGFTLDVGCGKHNLFVSKYLKGHGKGIDLYPYEGLSEENLVSDLTRFPFDSSTFDTVTFIANLNHVPQSQRDAELSEAFRVLKPGGNIVVTMGNPLAEILTHKVVEVYDRFLGTNFDMDNQRGMHEEEAYYLLDSEIKERLVRAGFVLLRKRRFWTQWGLNHLIAGCKPQG
ncbi:MAG: class I SAM-dependent methyltransferase [Candidatus Omnitrophica bacterium]|nr:class I SAM-dependent methyltransferase [Candidatus Omnitrophota bacterium]